MELAVGFSSLLPTHPIFWKVFPPSSVFFLSCTENGLTPSSTSSLASPGCFSLGWGRRCSRLSPFFPSSSLSSEEEIGFPSSAPLVTVLRDKTPATPPRGILSWNSVPSGTLRAGTDRCPALTSVRIPAPLQDIYFLVGTGVRCELTWLFPESGGPTVVFAEGRRILADPGSIALLNFREGRKSARGEVVARGRLKDSFLTFFEGLAVRFSDGRWQCSIAKNMDHRTASQRHFFQPLFPEDRS